MDYTTLGNTGLEVSQLCLGTWRFGKESGGVVETDRGEAHELLDAFADRGGNFIDTANGYGNGQSETWIGEWLADRDREDYVIASKVYWTQVSRPSTNLSRKTIRAEIDGTLERLDTDYLDVYYIHRWDENTPIEETLHALSGLVDEGKVHYLGASMMAAWQLTKALWSADTNGYRRFDVTQPRFHAAHDDSVDDYLAVCEDQDLAVCPYSPLAGGFLTGKYEEGAAGEVVGPDGSRGDLTDDFADWYVSDRGWRVLDVIESIGDEVGASPAQVALQWLIDQTEYTCVPIIGARTVEQLDENVGAVTVELTEEQHGRITDARRGHD